MARKASRAPAVQLPTTYPDKGMSNEHWSACLDILTNVYNAKDASRPMAGIFRQLPDREEYADYFEAIPEPECLDDIATRLGDGGFQTPEDFFKQLHLVFLNAKHYNEEGSQIWNDAKRLEDQIHQAWKDSGVFANPDPYHRGGPRKGRPPKGSRTSATPAPRASVTPAPALAPAPAPAQTAPTAHTPVTAPVVVPTPVKAPVHSLPSASTSASASTPVPPQLSAPSPIAFPVRTPTPMTQQVPTPAPGLETGPPSPSDSERARRQEQALADQSVQAALDARLPRWGGPQPVLPGPPNIQGIPGSGWWGEGAPDYERSAGGQPMWSQRMKSVARAINGYLQDGVRLADVFDAMPPVVEIPYLSFNAPLSFSSIQINVHANRYRTLRDFDIDMTRLFEKGRRFFPEGSAEYGRVIVLQRLYNALTAPYPLVLPASGIPDPSPTLFASLPAGPGNARSLHETTQELRAGAAEEDVGFGITTFRVGTKDRLFTDEARHKGMAYRLGDFVHLINPDDATRPIIGQIFKTFVPTKGYRTHHVTVCWYYRPEQTVHTQDRDFFDREVFKTSHFCDHPVEDVIERISIQFYVKWIRGRSQVPEYFPGWPAYICHSRYNDKLWLTVRIKNWGSCIPDELRQTNFMSVVPYDRQIEPVVVKSPFLRGVKGPGFFAEPRGKLSADDEDEDERERSDRRPKPPVKRATQSQPGTTPSLPSPAPPYAMAQPRPQNSIPGPGFSPLGGGPGPGPAYGVGQGSAPGYIPGPSQSPYRPPQPGPPPQSMGWSGPRMPPSPAGPQDLAVREVLPPDTARLFERDTRGQVLWFSGPPLAPGTIPVPQQPSHSLEYLEFLTKRKKGIKDGGDRERKVKIYRQRKTDGTAVKAQVEEEEEEDLWWAKGLSAEEIMSSLKAVIE